MSTISELAAYALSGGRGAHRINGEAERKFVKRLFNVGTDKRVMEAMASMPGMSTDGSDWDLNPDLLGCENAIVDLTTGVGRKGRPDDLVTRTTGVKWEPEAQCPTFRRFLLDITADYDGNARRDLAEYLMLALGASLFGADKPQQFYLLNGQPGAGKGALCRTIVAALGPSYVVTPDANIYSKTRFGRPRTDGARADLLQLRGARISFIHEPESPFDDNLLKNHSGGDPITARDLYKGAEDIKQWGATHTIMFTSNSLPAIEDVGAMRRRARVVPFVRNFEDRIDLELEPAMRREAPGILALLVAQAVKFRNDPACLIDPERMPPVVADESRAYLDDNDPLITWRNDRALIDRTKRTETAKAHSDYMAWFARSGNEGNPLIMQLFSVAAQKWANVAKQKTNGRTFLRGLALRYADHAGLPDDGDVG
jgi:putative DNA primase/helicase